jgi:murein DD-endopeptidase MepM/ murein hydrolase activator NlpD
MRKLIVMLPVMLPVMLAAITAIMTTIAVAVAVAVAGPARAGDWRWPVVGPVVQGFDPPASPFGSGHRGIDIAASPGTPIVAPAAGHVSFAGPVAGSLFVSIDHGSGLFSSYSWLSRALVRRGERVVTGQRVARSGMGHPSLQVAQLHMGVRLDGAYIDPLEYLGAASVSDLIRLAPLDDVA